MDDRIWTFFNSTFTLDFLFLENKRKTVREIRRASRPDLFDSYSFTVALFLLFFLISRRDGENNGLLPVVPLLPPRSCVVSRPNSLPLPFRTPVACVAGVWRGREREFWASEKREGLSRAPRVSLAPKTWAKGGISYIPWCLAANFCLLFAVERAFEGFKGDFQRPEFQDAAHPR